MSRKIEIYAHRGASGQYPENTMIAFQAAADIESDGIELDVQMTKDGELVVIHDERIDRTTNGIGYVKEHLYKQLRLYDAGSWFNNHFFNQRIPALEEVLQWMKGIEYKLTLNIELKNDRIDYPNIEEKVMNLLYEYNLEDRCIISSFNQNSLMKVREISSSIKTAYLFEGVPTDALASAKKLHVNAIHCEAAFAKSVIGQRAEKLGFPIRVYTVNTMETFKTLQNSAASVIMTDYPHMFLFHINRK